MSNVNIMVIGSENYNDFKQFCEMLDPVVASIERNYAKVARIITGKQNGTDSMSRRYAMEKGYPIVVSDDLFNQVNESEAVIAFRNSGNKNTNSIVGKAKDAGVPVTMIQINV